MFHSQFVVLCLLSVPPDAAAAAAAAAAGRKLLSNNDSSVLSLEDVSSTANQRSLKQFFNPFQWVAGVASGASAGGGSAAGAGAAGGGNGAAAAAAAAAAANRAAAAAAAAAAATGMLLCFSDHVSLPVDSRRDISSVGRNRSKTVSCTTLLNPFSASLLMISKLFGVSLYHSSFCIFRDFWSCCRSRSCSRRRKSSRRCRRRCMCALSSFALASEMLPVSFINLRFNITYLQTFCLAGIPYYS